MEYKFTVDNFEEEVLKSELPVLVDLYADWCSPCQRMAPIVERLAEEYEGKMKIGKCDTGVNMPLVQKYGVSNIPAFMIFKGGEVVERFVGSKFEDEMCDIIDKYI